MLDFIGRLATRHVHSPEALLISATSFHASIHINACLYMTGYDETEVVSFPSIFVHQKNNKIVTGEQKECRTTPKDVKGLVRATIWIRRFAWNRQNSQFKRCGEIADLRRVGTSKINGHVVSC